jgi:hypothetical protein
VQDKNKPRNGDNKTSVFSYFNGLYVREQLEMQEGIIKNRFWLVQRVARQILVGQRAGSIYKNWKAFTALGCLRKSLKLNELEFNYF